MRSGTLLGRFLRVYLPTFSLKHNLGPVLEEFISA